MEHYQHPQSIVESKNIGKNTRIWAFAHILSNAVIGEECNIFDGVYIENDVVIGNRVTIKCGVQICDGVKLEDDVFVGPNATFTNDLFPRSNHNQEKTPQTLIHKGASIAANATILPGVQVGSYAMVEAGAVVTRNVPSYAVVVGNPAVIHGYVSTSNNNIIQSWVTTNEPEVMSVSRAKLISLPRIVDLRGSLSFGEYDNHVPFIPKRYFVIFEVPSIEVRGEHAHREQHQYLVCLKGSCTIVIDDGENREELVLHQPDISLYIPPMIWAVEYKFSKDAILLVLASDIYNEKDYIRDYDEYLGIIKKVEEK